METIAIYLGATRSLSTITSAMMALHPEVTVLNHAYGRIMTDARNDFLGAPVQERLERFTQTALDMALGGRKGDFGGHILHSHAFDDETLRQAYLDRYGWGAKPGTKSLVWKEGTLVTNRIARDNLDIVAIARSLPALRFIALVRNPVDIAISSIDKGYAKALVSSGRERDFDAVFTQILKRFAWFSQYASHRPDQFRFIFQDELLDRRHLASLCDFLRISAARDWLDDIGRLVQLRPSYSIPDDNKAKLKTLAMRIIPESRIATRVAEQIL